MTKIEKLKSIFNLKQMKVLLSKARIIIAHGAKRSGKTYILVYKFMLHVKSFKGKKFIIAGPTSSSVKINILDEIEAITGIPINLSKYSTFRLFGNVMVVRYGEKSDSWKRVRGFTSHGALVNEGTALDDMFIKEVISRCSGEGARIFIDTNPENPVHPIKLDYIDKHGERLENGNLNIEAIHFELNDNKQFLDPIYVESIIKSTPSGMFYDRDILGLWVNAEGIVYKDYNSRIHLIDKIPVDEEIIEYIIAVDWGFEHYGSLGVIGYSTKGNYYLIEEHTKKHMYVEDYWLKLALEKKEQYKICIGFEEEKLPDGTPKPKYRYPIFYVDSARQEYRNLFIDNNIEAMNANKAVIEGIQTVGTLFKTNKLFILKDGIDRFEIEINSYVWSNQVGAEEKVKKVNDDCMDMIRYAVHSHKTQGEGIRLGGDYN